MDKILEAPKPSETLEAPKPSEILDARDVASTHAHVHDLHRVCGNATWEWGRGTLVYHYIRLAAFFPHIRFGSIFPFPAQNPESFLFQNQIKFSLSKLQTLFLLFGKQNDSLLLWYTRK